MLTAARVFAMVVACSCAASAARAQYPQRRDGFWIGFGLGYGTANVRCDICGSGPRKDGITGFVKVGGTPRRNLLIGGAVNAWSHSDGSVAESMTNVTASVYLYPDVNSGLFVTGGLGFANYHVNSDPSFNGTGWGFTGGVGYDIRVGRDVSLTPVVNYMYGGVGDVNEAGFGAVRSQWNQNVVDFGLGVTFH
jgi:outer membrane protein with beta-barrel domain